jgi:hypothetical protein
MAPRYIRALSTLAHVWPHLGWGGIGLIVGVSGVWLAVFAAIVLTVPEPQPAVQPGSAYTVGHLAHLQTPPGGLMRVPLELDTFKDFYQALWDDNGLALREVLSRPGWVQIVDHQTVRIVNVYEQGIHVELLDGPSTGVHAWVMLHQLSP